MSIFISIDPGKSKCGLILADVKSRKVIEAGISSLTRLNDIVSLWNDQYKISKVLIGDGTNSEYIGDQLKQINTLDLNYVNEKGSTLRARFRYWENWPPNLFFRWLPKELLFPPENLDAVVALILLEEFMKFNLIWPDKLDIKTWL